MEPSLSAWQADLEQRCVSAGIPDQHRDALIALARRKIDNRAAAADTVAAELLADYHDWRLLCQSIDGDGVAQDTFFRTWRGRALGFFQRRGVPVEDREDLYQHFCERLLRYRVYDRFSWQSTFRAYCYTMLAKIAIDYGERRVRWLDVPSALELAPDAAPTPDRQCAIKEEFARFETAFAELSPRDQRIFLKFYADGDNAAAIGDAVGLKPNAVQQRLSRIRKRLRVALSAFAPEPVGTGSRGEGR